MAIASVAKFGEMYPRCFMHFLKALEFRQNYWARNYNIKKSNLKW
jgi:hypothetical protein